MAFLNNNIPLLWLIAGIIWAFILVMFILIWLKERKKDASRKLMTSIRDTLKECSPFYHADKEESPEKPSDSSPTHLDAEHLTDWQKAICDEIDVQEQTVLQNTNFAETYLNYRSRTGIDLIKMLGDKGMRGEFQTFSRLAKHFGPHYVFSDLYLKKQDGHTSQIDLVLLTPKEIYIIENKNYAGSVYGTEQSTEWKQYLSGREFRFQNPIRQNEGHCRAFRAFFPQIPPERIFSIVVFNNLCKLKVDTVTPVIARDELTHVIEERQADKDTYFSDSELELCSKMLMYCSLQSEQVKQNHIEYVKKIKSNA